MRASGGDVVIVGAGLIGLSIAWELALRGATVRVFDRAEPAGGASWAAAGMLAPFTEHVEDAPLLNLCLESLAQYPGFVERLRDESGVDAHLRLDGILDVAFDAKRATELQARGARLRARGFTCEWHDRIRLHLSEPALDPMACGGLFVNGEGSVDNRRLGRALAAACLARGVSIVGGAGEVAIECDSRRARGVRSTRGFTPAGAIVNAAGAWAARIPGVPAPFVPPIEPVKGQMLALAVPDGLVRRTTWVPGAYLVPREAGRLIVGATVERVGFDERVTARGQHQLLDAVLAAAPALGGFAVTEAWSGLRPATQDGRPILGASGLDGLWLATGHYRNGILLAPVTGRLLADAIEGAPRSALAPFGLERTRMEADSRRNTTA